MGGGRWVEAARGCFMRRYAEFDVTVGVVVGERGALLIDTRASRDQGARLRGDLRDLGVAEPFAVVNTHAHFDHCYGNAAFAPSGGVWGHASLPAALAGTARAALREEFPDWAAAVEGEPLSPPTDLVTGRAIVDLGDRAVEFRHFGRGHTEGDLVVWVPEVRCAYAGDLVEQSGPPAYGSDSFPLEWPWTLDLMLTTVGEGVVIVPGHGDAVDAAFAQAQRDRVAAVAERVRRCHASGLGEAAALAEADWPYDPALLGHAVRRGYAHCGDRAGGRPAEDGSGGSPGQR